MSKTPRLICIAGPDGSGKTTQLTKLAEHFAFDNKNKVAAVTIWDMLLDPKFKELIAFKSPRQVDKYLGTLDPIARSLFLYHCMKQALALALQKDVDVILLNAYWYKYYATEVAHGGDATLLRTLAEQIFPEPELTLYLDVSPQESAQRKGDAMLSDYETGFAANKTQEAFIALQTVAQAELAKLSIEKGWKVIDGTLGADKITSEIMAAIHG